jgi:hypothetical protein
LQGLYTGRASAAAAQGLRAAPSGAIGHFQAAIGHIINAAAAFVADTRQLSPSNK